MPLVITDGAPAAADLDPDEALREFACRLLDTGKVSPWNAAKLAGLDRVAFESELHGRGIPIYRPTLDDLADDREAVKRLGRRP